MKPDAYEAYLEGNAHSWGIDEEGDRARSRKMIQCYSRAVEIDPEFALAHAALALAHVNLATVGNAPGESGLEARRSAQRAVELDEGLAEAHAALGSVRFNLDWDWSGAAAELERALELNPSSVDALLAWKFYLLVTGRGEEAIVVGRRLCELEANSDGIVFELGWTCLCARRYDEAIATFRGLLAKNAGDAYTRAWLADAYALKGMCGRFHAECDSLRTLGSDGRPYSYALCGQRGKALSRLEELRASSVSEYVDPVDPALYCAVLGDKDQAFAWLRKGFESRSVGMARVMKADPYFDGLRSDPRWSELLRQMKFPEGGT